MKYHTNLFHHSFNIFSEFQRWTIELISQDGAAFPASGAQSANAQSKWEGESSTEECCAEAP